MGLTQVAKNLIVTSLLLAASSPALADRLCRELFLGPPSLKTQVSRPVQARERLKAQLLETDVSFFLKSSANGPIPVILANARTTPALRDLLNHSLGIQVLLQPGSVYTDHGMIRIGNILSSRGQRESVQMDWGLPDARGAIGGGNDELHKTGLAWRSVDERLASNEARGKYTLKTIEATFLLSEKERSDLEFYHRARRAGIFARAFIDWQGLMQPQLPNRMAAFEDCFMYCRGTELRDHEARIIDHLRSFGPYDLEPTMQAPETRAFLKWARAKIMKAPWWTKEGLRPDMLHSEAAVSKLAPVLPDLTKDKEGKLRATAYDFANWLVALEVTRIARGLTESLGVSKGWGVSGEIHNPRITAILIYDSPAVAPRFNDATYATPGKFDYFGWGDGPASDIKPYSDQYRAR